MLDQHLWDIYSTCAMDELVRSLILYELNRIDIERLTYKFVIFTPNVDLFFKNIHWIKQFGCIFHAEHEYQFKPYGNILNCSAVYENGWSVQFLFISNNVAFNYLKQKRMYLLLDKDQRFNKEQIKIEGIKYGKWYQLPDENELMQFTEKFYIFILKSSRLIKNNDWLSIMHIEYDILEPLVVTLMQWLSYCDELFTLEELGDIKSLVYDAKVLLPTVKEQNHLKRLCRYLKVGEHLIDNYSNIMDYENSNANINHLKQCVSIQLEQHFKQNLEDNEALICLY